MTLAELKRLLIRIPGCCPVSEMARQWETFYKPFFRLGFPYTGIFTSRDRGEVTQ